jgi:hypothetical protein
LMKNQNYIIIMKGNYVELRYKGTGLILRMKTSENLYIFFGKRQPEYALKYLQLRSTENNSRVLHNNLHKNTFYTSNVHNLPYLASSIAENGRTYGLKYQKVHQIITTGGSNSRYSVVRNTLLNNGKLLTTGRRSIYMANDHRTDNTAYQGNISAPVIQGDISANQGEISAVKKKKIKTMDINEALYKMGHMGEVALRKLLNHHNIKQQENSKTVSVA